MNGFGDNMIRKLKCGGYGEEREHVKLLANEAKSKQKEQIKMFRDFFFFKCIVKKQVLA